MKEPSPTRTYIKYLWIMFEKLKIDLLILANLMDQLMMLRKLIDVFKDKNKNLKHCIDNIIKK